MRAKEMRERTDEEIQTMEETLRQEIFTARFKNHTNRLYDSSELPKKRRDLARLLTIKQERLVQPNQGTSGETDEAEG